MTHFSSLYLTATFRTIVIYFFIVQSLEKTERRPATRLEILVREQLALSRREKCHQ